MFEFAVIIMITIIVVFPYACWKIITYKGEFPKWDPSKCPPPPPIPEIDYPHKVSGSYGNDQIRINTRKNKKGYREYLQSHIKWALCPGLTVTAEKRQGLDMPFRISGIAYDYLIHGHKKLIPELIDRELEEVLK